MPAKPSSDDDPSPVAALLKLYQDIARYFNKSELHDLCLRLEIDAESLPGQSKLERARELVLYCDRHGRLLQLVTACRALRPHVAWETPAETAVALPTLRPPFIAPPAVRAGRLARLAIPGLLLALLAFLVVIAGGAAQRAFAGAPPAALAAPTADELDPPLSAPLPFGAADPAAQTLPQHGEVYSFEEGPPPEWRIENGTLHVTQTQAFAGRAALAVQTALQEPLAQAPGRAARLRLPGAATERLVIVRLYAPPEAPANAMAQWFVEDEDGRFFPGAFSLLTPGAWTTLAWATRDSAPFSAAAGLGLELALQPSRPDAPADAPVYEGAILLDLVELLHLPQVHQGGPSLDATLRPWRFYDFEQVTAVPEAFSAVADVGARGRTRRLSLAQEVSLPGGASALRLDLDLAPYTTEYGFGGLALDLGTAVVIDAVNAHVLIPESEETAAAQNFHAQFMALDQYHNLVYSASTPLTVGVWTPLFWGTRYAHGLLDVCRDANRDGQCDAPAGLIWKSWRDPQIKRIDLRIWREGVPYRGPAYVDEFGLYQLAPPQE